MSKEMRKYIDTFKQRLTESENEILKQIKEVVKNIEENYEVEPNDENQGDCLNAKEGFEILIKQLKKLIK